VQVSGTSLKFDVAMAKQGCASAEADCPLRQFFKEVLQGAVDEARGKVAGTADTVQNSAAPTGLSKIAKARPDAKQIEAKLNEALALTFFAPMLASAMNESQQAYFVNSPTEQAYARQLYMQVATKIGQSGKLPLARNIAQAFRRQLMGTSRASQS